MISKTAISFKTTSLPRKSIDTTLSRRPIVVPDDPKVLLRFLLAAVPGLKKHCTDNKSKKPMSQGLR